MASTSPFTLSSSQSRTGFPSPHQQAHSYAPLYTLPSSSTPPQFSLVTVKSCPTTCSPSSPAIPPHMKEAREILAHRQQRAIFPISAICELYLWVICIVLFRRLANRLSSSPSNLLGCSDEVVEADMRSSDFEVESCGLGCIVEDPAGVMAQVFEMDHSRCAVA